MAETVRKKAAKKASGKKRGRPKRKGVKQTTTHLERLAAVTAAGDNIPYDEALQKVTAEYEARTAQVEPKVFFLIGLATTLTRSMMIGFLDVIPVYLLMGAAIIMMIYEAFFDKD